MIMNGLLNLRTTLSVEPGIWFFGAFTGLLAFGYLEVMSRALSVI
jgi:hypothetical protein